MLVFARLIDDLCSFLHKLFMNRFRLLIFAPLLLICFPLIWGMAEDYSRGQALQALGVELDSLAEQRAQVLEAELSQFRLLPTVLAGFPDLKSAVEGADLAPQHLNHWLASLAAQIGSPAIYAMNGAGLVLASSNGQGQDSFLGRDFSNRRYFQEALSAGSAMQHGAGLLTGRASLFFAHRLGRGVVALKYEFDAVMQLWRESGKPVWIYDWDGALLTASHSLDQADFLTRRRPVFGTELVLVQGLDPKSALNTAKRQAWLIALPGLMGLGMVGGLIIWRFRRANHDLAQRRALVQAVEAATKSLRQEMGERAREAEAYRSAREALAQANRLAALGQITAGLAHEINQPIATIRTLSENASQHLAAGNYEKVARSLAKTGQLTAKIGAITAQMRKFAQRRGIKPGAVRLDQVIEGANLILGDRLRPLGAGLSLSPKGLRVRGDLIGLEQVLVNLVQNALEALKDHPKPVIELRILEDDLTPGYIQLMLADNGPGVAADLRESLFNPFVSGRPEGLGLGLGIARDILRALDGELSLAPSPLGGAAFVMRMKQEAENA